MRAGVFVLVLAAVGCNNPVYLAETGPIETQPGMMGGYQPATALYVLPVRQPTDVERMALGELQQRLMLPSEVPWAQARDFDIEIQYSVKNLETTKVIVFVTCDGGNEYGDYVPGAYIDPTQNAEDQTPPPPLLSSAPLEIAPGGTVTGVFREDDFQESA